MKQTITKTSFTNEQLMKLLITDPRTVPCNGCKECCKGDKIALKRYLGDQPENYLCHQEEGVNGLTGLPEMQWVLDHKPNGDCVYLNSKGCSIHGRAPAVCREFDCRALFVTLTREQRREWVKNGAIKKAVFDAARKRLDTMTPQSKEDIRAQKERLLNEKRQPPGAALGTSVKPGNGVLRND
jgi:hypothetical protein